MLAALKLVARCRRFPTPSYLRAWFAAGLLSWMNRMTRNIWPGSGFGCWMVAWVLATLVGCGESSKTEPSATAARPVSSSSGTADPATLPADAEILKQIDDALEYTYDHRRLSVGPSANDQAAWQILHGALAFKREFLVNDGQGDVSAVDYILAGRKMKGMDLRRGDLLDDATKRYGIATVIAEDKMGQGHQDQWLGYLSDCRLPLDEKIVVEGQEQTIADYIDQAKLDVSKNSTQEYSWTLMALTAYYPTDYTWKAGDGSEYSIEKLVEIELGHNLESSACGGTHRMTALTMAFNRHVAAGKPVAGVWKKLEERIAECVEKSRQFQNSDGSLSSNYFNRPGKSADLAVCMGSAGHVVEFIATALNKEKLQQPWVKRAVLDMCKTFRRTKPVDVECGALFHAAHGLVLYREKVFGPRTFGKDEAAAVTAAKGK